MSKELTNNEIDDIVNTAKTARYNSEAIDMLDIKNDVKVDENADLEYEVKEGKVDSSTDLITAKVDTMPSADVSLFDLDGDEIKKDEDIQVSKDSVIDAAKETYDLSDEEAIKIIDLVSNIRKDPKYPVYNNLPDNIKNIVNDIASKNGIPVNQRNALARMILMEMMNDSELESSFIDLEKAINEALNIPSIMDLYTEHVKTVMEENIPKMVEEIKDTDPDKAKMLSDVKDRFILSYSFDFAKEEYMKNSRLRKAVRRYDVELKRNLDSFNFMNDKSNFKMNDVKELPSVLNKILIKDIDPNKEMPTGTEHGPAFNKCLETKVTDKDIAKFCVLITKSCENLNPRNILDAVYMYYMMKNIIMLKYTNEAKTTFAAELINNICDTIVFIRNKEEEFYAANMVKSEH